MNKFEKKISVFLYQKMDLSLVTSCNGAAKVKFICLPRIFVLALYTSYISICCNGKFISSEFPEITIIF